MDAKNVTCSSAATKTNTATSALSLDAHGSSGAGRLETSTITDVERGEVDVGLDQHLLVEVGVELADERDAADRDPLRIERRELRRSASRR